jgi:hypothetical protein
LSTMFPVVASIPARVSRIVHPKIDVPSEHYFEAAKQRKGREGKPETRAVELRRRTGLWRSTGTMTCSGGDFWESVCASDGDVCVVSTEGRPSSVFEDGGLSVDGRCPGRSVLVDVPWAALSHSLQGKK